MDAPPRFLFTDQEVLLARPGGTALTGHRRMGLGLSFGGQALAWGPTRALDPSSHRVLSE